MTWKQVVPVLLGVGLMSGCATAELSQRGGRVLPLAAAPSEECKNLGTVIGEGGGVFFGGLLSNKSLTRYAFNDAMNETAERGGTHLVVPMALLGSGVGTTTTATVVAIGYQCPVGVHGAADMGSADLPGASTPGAPAAPSAPTFLSKCPSLEGESTRARAMRCRKLAEEQKASE